MGIIRPTTLLFTLGLLLAIFSALKDTPTLKKVDENKWWGSFTTVSNEVLPFKIQVDQKVIKDLNERLDIFLKSNLTPSLESQGFQYGVNTKYLKKVVYFWRNNYEWKERESYLNRYPHYVTGISGLKIHFMRVSPLNQEKKKVVPLLLVHGWPGSFREFYDIIPLLTTSRKDYDFVFEVVIPSLPGYGFSQGATKPGFGTTQIAILFNRLMNKLNFTQYYVQGGDWGSAVIKNMAILYPHNVLGGHSNFCLANSKLANLKWLLASLYPHLFVREEHVNRLSPIHKRVSILLEETGYLHLQATKPDTIGAALMDTPSGLAGYILEKFSAWTDPSWKCLEDGGLTRKFSLTDLLDNIMIYWVSGSITTSLRLYAEHFNSEGHDLDKIAINVPFACARFRHEMIWQPEMVLNEKYANLVQVNDFDIGGHFAAFEEPDILSQDIWSAVDKIRSLKV